MQDSVSVAPTVKARLFSPVHVGGGGGGGGTHAPRTMSQFPVFRHLWDEGKALCPAGQVCVSTASTANRIPVVVLPVPVHCGRATQSFWFGVHAPHAHV